MWVLHESKATQMRVGFVEIVSSAEREGIPEYERVSYAFRVSNPDNFLKRWLYKRQSEVFATKEELLASL